MTDECRDPACTVHPHCVCGARLDDVAGMPVWTCPECGTDALSPEFVRPGGSNRTEQQADAS